ncbi:hypothetical protein [Hydrogenophaga sp.]|uniref:hypothetical protein n=1 Tax=Hydrogenophaga sp. TaxID=1904254 RepID=UPI002724B7AB|nr:hypothetical protein [Hydrogenophaga sp.]MDO9436619.1 hypothetical protein [Hydrogenophaga sp.]
MFIFSRRWLQRCIDDLAAILDADALHKIVARLNRRGMGRLPAMWELVFLKALSRSGQLRHEVQLPNGRNPDFEWTLADGGREVCVWGDITTVSDAGLDEKNPVDHLCSEITRLARKYKLKPNHFRFDVRGGRVGEYRKSAMELFLPKRGELQELIKAHVEPFIRNVSQAPHRNAHFDYKEVDADFSVTYDQSQAFAGGGYLCYDVAVSLTNNPIFKALKAKTAQLSCAPDDALRLIILCDADCAAMRHDPLSSTAYSSGSIAAEFLRQSKSVDAVLLATVRSISHGILLPRELALKFDLVVSRAESRPLRMSDERCAVMEEALNRAVAVFPSPQLEPQNAVRRCFESGYGYGKRGAHSMSQKTIKISSRALLQLLAGDISQDTFLKEHGWTESEFRPSYPNPFQMALKRGDMFKVVRVEGGGDADDDWIAFDLTDPDPSISPFRSVGARPPVASPRKLPSNPDEAAKD